LDDGQKELTPDRPMTVHSDRRQIVYGFTARKVRCWFIERLDIT